MQLSHCHEDSYCSATKVTVLSCQPEGDSYRVVTDRSIAFPGGGGQPEDIATLSGAPILSYLDSGDAAFHFRLEQPVSEGIHLMEIDWSRRFDHMQQHTAQHLLTALALDRFGWSTLAFHLNPERSDIVLDCVDPSENEIRELEDAVNDAIRGGAAVLKRQLSRSELVNEGARFRRLPPGDHDTYRMIEIPGVDLNPCGGTHVQNLAELQVIQLLSAQTEKGKQTRLHFLAGERVRRRAALSLRQEQSLTQLLSETGQEQVGAVERLLARERRQSKRLQKLEAELGRQRAKGLMAETRASVVIVRSPLEPEYLNGFSAELQAIRPDLLVLLIGERTGSGVFSIIGPEELVPVAGRALTDHLSARGGGKGGRFQGRFELTTGQALSEAQFESVIRTVLP